MKGIIKEIYDQFKGKPTIASNGQQYKTIVITDTQTGTDNKFRVFQSNPLFASLNRTLKGKVVEYETAVFGQYVNLSNMKITNEDVEIQKVRDENISKIAEEKLALEYRKLAYEILRDASKYEEPGKFKSADDYIRAHLFDIEDLVMKLRYPSIEPEEIEIKGDKK